MKDRINDILQKYNLTSSDFADKIGVGKSNISHILGGRNNPSLEIVKKILLEFPEINSEWLLFGTGSETKTSDTIKTKSENETSSIAPKTPSSLQLEFKEDDDDEQVSIKPETTEPIKEQSKEDIDIKNSDDFRQNESKSLTDPNNENQTTPYKDKDIVNNENIKGCTKNKVATKIIIYYSDRTYQQFEANDLPL